MKLAAQTLGAGHRVVGRAPQWGSGHALHSAAHEFSELDRGQIAQLWDLNHRSGAGPSEEQVRFGSIQAEISDDQQTDQQEVNQQARDILHDRAYRAAPQGRVGSEAMESPREAEPDDCRNHPAPEHGEAHGQ